MLDRRSLTGAHTERIKALILLHGVIDILRDERGIGSILLVFAFALPSGSTRLCRFRGRRCAGYSVNPELANEDKPVRQSSTNGQQRILTWPLVKVYDEQGPLRVAC